jgi:tetratricopeptide (TPR) repeat protein
LFGEKIPIFSLCAVEELETVGFSMEARAMANSSQKNSALSRQPITVEGATLRLEQILRLRERDPQMALTYCEQLLPQLDVFSMSQLWLQAQMTYAHVLIAVGRPVEALRLCKRFEVAITRTAAINDRVRSLYYAACGVGNTYTGHYTQAMECFERLLKLAQHTRNQREECRALINIGWVHTCLEDFPTALAFFSRALTLAQYLKLDIAQAITVENMGVVYGAVGNDELALANYQHAYQLRRLGGYTAALAQSMLNIAAVHNRRGEYRKALNLARPALEIARHCSNLRVEAFCLVAIGRAYRGLGQFKRALHALEKALELRQKAEYVPELCSVHTDIASVWERLGNGRKERAHLDKAYALAQRINEPSMLTYVSEQLYLYAKRTGDVEEALLWLEQHHQWYVALTERRKEEEAARTMMMEAIAKLAREHESYRQQIADLEATIQEQHRQLQRLVLDSVASSSHSRTAAVASLVAVKDEFERSQEPFDPERLIKFILERIDYLLPGYIHALAARIPLLTPMELLICGLLRLQLRSKEIAELLGVTTKTVNRHREHIRAKCGIGRRINLTTYLCSIA